MKTYKQIFEENLPNMECPHCHCKDVGVDKWDMFKGPDDWFYYCKECDMTFNDYKLIKRLREEYKKAEINVNHSI